MVRLIIRPAAGADLRDAIRWYDEESPGLGDRFLDDLRETYQEAKACSKSDKRSRT